MNTTAENTDHLPKIFSWAHACEQEILKSVNAPSSDFLPLSGRTARQMTLLFLTSTVEHLKQMQKFRVLLGDSGNQGNVINNEEIAGIMGHMVADCRKGLAKLKRLEFIPIDILSAIKAELRSASRFLFELCERWRETKPALQFLLLGGEEALNRVYKGEIPGKVKTIVAYEVTILGAKHPNMREKFAKRRPQSITNDMMSDARAALMKIDADTAFNFSQGNHYSGSYPGTEVFVGGTQVFTSLKGRTKGPASKGKKPRRKGQKSN